MIDRKVWPGRRPDGPGRWPARRRHGAERAADRGDRRGRPRARPRVRGPRNVPVREPASRVPPNARARFLDEIAECCRALRRKVEGILEEGSFPLVVGGDHSIACGTVAAISSFHHRRKEKIGLIWFDAHGDFNTPETSESGNIHGMPLACCVGRGVPELVRLGDRVPMVDVEKAVLLGVRTIDRREKEEIKDSGLHVFTLRDIDMHGIHKVMRMAIEIASTGTAGFHLTFDSTARTRPSRRASGRRCRAGRRCARATSSWSTRPSPVACSASR
jgi:arginase